MSTSAEPRPPIPLPRPNGPRRRFFSVYQYLVPATLFPLSYWLWLRRFDGSHALACVALSVPVVFGYVIPGLGTNWVGLWEINTRLRVGRFRPHHGFVFGTGSSLLAMACLPHLAGPPDGWEVARAGFIVGSVLGFWNWLYDTYAIKAKFILIHNRLAAEGHAAEVVATDHAPILFGVFGLCYGVFLRLVERLPHTGFSTGAWVLLVAGNLAGLVLPLLAYVVSSYIKRGESGLKVYRTSSKGDSR